jgi:hypothetical protein
MNETPDSTHGRFEVDERFLTDWITFGMRELDAYLAKHARFARYLDGRGDAAPDLG